MPKKEKSKDVNSMCIKLGSILDLARNACTFSDGMHPIYAFKEKGNYWMFTPGMKLGEIRLLMVFESAKIARYLVYNPGNGTEKENCELKDEIKSGQGLNFYNMPIIELQKNPFIEKGKVKVMNLKVKSFGSVVEGIITKSLDNGDLGKVYAFTNKKKRYIGAFNLMEEEDMKMFCYAELPIQNKFSFFRYNYSSGKIEQTDTYGEHSYMYVKVINLANAFPFFKPE